MLFIGQNTTSVSPIFFLFCRLQKYLKSKCLILFELEFSPFLANNIVIMLSWYLVVVGTYMPRDSKKCIVHSTCNMTSSIANTFASVELYVEFLFSQSCVCCTSTNHHVDFCMAFQVWFYSI